MPEAEAGAVASFTVVDDTGGKEGVVGEEEEGGSAVGILRRATVDDLEVDGAGAVETAAKADAGAVAVVGTTAVLPMRPMTRPRFTSNALRNRPRAANEGAMTVAEEAAIFFEAEVGGRVVGAAAFAGDGVAAGEGLGGSTAEATFLASSPPLKWRRI